jgi:predicted secreted protein
VEVISGMAETIKRPRHLWLGLEPDDIDDPEEAGVWRQVIASLGEATVSSAASLAALSSDPGAKKALWRSLRQSGRS